MYIGYLVVTGGSLYLIKKSYLDDQYYLAAITLKEVPAVREIRNIKWSVSYSKSSTARELKDYNWVPQQYIGEVQ